MLAARLAALGSRARLASSTARMASTLVVAEHDGKALAPGTLAAVTAAKKVGGSIDLLVMGKGTDSVAALAAKVDGVARVLKADADILAHSVAEDVTAVVLACHGANKYSHILAPASNFGKNFLPRVAAKLDVAQISDVIAVESADTFRRPMYAGNAIAKVRSKDAVKTLTIRATGFEKAGMGAAAAAKIEAAPTTAAAGKATFVSEAKTESDRPELDSARVVVSGGRGLKSGDNFSLLFALADKLNAAVGASRAAVDAEFCPNDMQVGQTGKIVAPELYIAVGISGAIQHLAGMKDSKVIVSINKDEEAPIFAVSDYGLVADLFKAVPELTDKVARQPR